ncbi:MAG: phage holin family protein [Patescibacteria group bacterium]
MSIFLRWLVNALVILGISYYIPGITVAGFYSALIAALVLGLLNVFIRPIVIFFTLPVNILTLGLFTFVINALMFLLVASIVKGFNVAGFWPAFWGALILTLINWLIGLIANPARGL